MSELSDTSLEESTTIAPPDPSRFWFVCCIANPMGFKSRYNLYHKFVDHVMNVLQGNLVVVECAYHGSDHVLASASSFGGRLIFVPVRSDSVMWHKENMLNAGIRVLRMLRPEATHVIWADADIEFVKGKAALDDIVRAFAKHEVVQVFNTCMDTGPDGEVLKLDHGYVFSAVHHLGPKATPDQTTWHTGYVWAASMEYLKRIGGLFDLAILGSGDRLMADAFLGRFENYQATGHGRGDFDAMVEWGRYAHQLLGPVDARGLPEGLGFVPVIIKHGFHGFKKDRGYNTRGAILIKNKYVPWSDLCVNADGMYEWSPDRVGSLLEHDVINYFASRNEDATRKG